jgi:exoribonuclease R
LIEELPVEQRVIVHQQVLKFLNEHPENAADAKVIAVDEKGTVYVLDDKMEKMVSVGQPSCVGGL